MRKAFYNGNIVTMNDSLEILSDGAFIVEDNTITHISSSKEILEIAEHNQIEKDNLNGCSVFPGLINTHTHLFQNLLKGIGTDRNMEDWWDYTIGKYAINLDIEHIEAAATAGLLEGVKTGTTTFLDYMYVHPVPYCSDVTIDSAKRIGARIAYGRGFNVSNEFVPIELREGLEDIFQDILRLKDKYRSDNMVNIWMAPAVNWTMNREEFIRMNLFSKKHDIPVSMHLLETSTDNKIWESYYKKNLMEDLDSLQFLSKDFLAVHFVDVTDKDIERLIKSGAALSHNPVSNMYLASGVSPILELYKQGVEVSLGTDGSASNNTQDMLETMKMTALLHKVAQKNPAAISASDVLWMATRGGAKALHLDDQIGSIEIGKKADFFIFDARDSLKSTPVHDPIATLVYSSSSESIRDVIIDGNYIIKNKEAITVNEKDVIRNERIMSEDIIRKAGGYHD